MESPRASAIATGLVEQAGATPDRLALWDRTVSFTFAELDALVATLAATLAGRRAELGACGVVPLIVGRDATSVVAINAALRAGIAFAPLDPGLGAGAIAGLLARIDGPRVAVVSRPDYAAVLPAGVRAVDVPRRPGDGIDPQPVDPANVNRVLFTSGSSGEPKGVALDGNSLDAFVGDPIVTGPADHPDYRVLNVSPFSFAAGTVMAIRPALGTAVSIVDPNAHDPVDLFEIFDSEHINAITIVPSHLATLLDRWPTGRRLEHALSARVFGEPLEWSMVPGLRRLLPQSAVVVNVYGATESGGPVFAMAITNETPAGTGRVPLGRPVGRDLIRLDPLADDANAPAEVVVRGPRLALGYWRDPEMTARAFGVDDDGTRTWRSGDIVRVDADGIFHFVGRRDNVVKINGRLVEPSEPERVLGSVAGVRRAVVLVQPAPRGGQRLVAHVEVDPASNVSPAFVRATVAEQVAPHLVPSVLVRHDRIPVTGRGKVDRQALLGSATVPWYERASDRRPVAFEVAVLDVFGDIVGHRAAGPDDDLWEAGLDSLGATELLAALQDFGWPAMPESVLIEHRSAAALDALRADFVAEWDVIWLNRDATGRPLVCVLPASSDALTFRRLAHELGADHPVAIVRQFDPVSTAPPSRSVAAIAGDVVERVRGELDGRVPVLVGYSASGVVAYEAARYLQADGAPVEVALLDAPAGAWTVRGRTTSTSAARRFRSVARQAWLRALPPMTMPQRERAFARFEIAARAAEAYVPEPSTVPVTLFRARHGGLTGLAEDWARATAHLSVVDLDCDHYEILDRPAITAVADWARTRGESVRA